MEQSGHPMKAGTAGGTLLVLLVQISTGEVFKTVILAAIGASVSFAVTLGWKWMVQKIRARKVKG